MSNCVSYADVYGQNFVGGMAGQKGQSMGPYEFTNCSFMGKIEATGKFAGGIAGGGYAADSAPNTPGATIQNCYVSGNITGSDCVGGILGGEPSQLQAWNTSYIQDNCFYGKVAATDKNVIQILTPFTNARRVPTTSATLISLKITLKISENSISPTARPRIIRVEL